MSRLTDRVRPWRAPVPAPHAPTVAVVGGGAAGLSAAVMLRRQGFATRVLEESPAPTGSWPKRYDCMRLNTVRWMSDLPGYPMPAELGRWVGRDALAEYLQDYARWHRLDVEVGTTVRRIDPSDDRWSIATSDQLDATSAEGVDGVVVATGHSRMPVTPEWEGMAGFRGSLIHSAAYRNPDEFAGRRVLVVGAGSSGGEIIVDLARAGVEVTWSVRTAPQVFPREAAGVPTTPFAPVADFAPRRATDAMAPRVERLIYGPRDYLPEPVEPMMELLARCKEPLTADGIVDLVRTGRVRLVPAVESLTPDGARLADGSEQKADVVLAATGFRPGLEDMVGHLGVLDEHGRPVAAVPRPGLGFIGFRVPMTGTLWAIRSDSARLARGLLATDR